MKKNLSSSPRTRDAGFLTRLGQDTSGNTLALMAAGILPLLAMVGGAVDMSRAYLANSRLQQACDSGVLAARKYLGSSVVVDGKVPADVATIGNRFFELNYKDGEYGTAGRDFQMFLESDFSISGEAEVQVPTVVMNVFGVGNVPVEVECQADMSVPAVDIMMALDVTGSMQHTNSGDTLSRIESLKQVIRNFHAKIEGSKQSGTEIRYGFVPYNANVNVGALLDNKWVVDDWTYQSREVDGSTVNTYNTTYWQNWTHVSGSVSEWTVESSYAATANTTTTTTGTGEGSTTTTTTTYSCTGSTPSSSFSSNDTFTSTATEAVTDPDGTRTIEYGTRVENGTSYQTVRVGTTCEVRSRVYSNYTNTFERVTEPRYSSSTEFTYKPLSHDVKKWRTETDGCIEERSTYEITDYDNVDLTQALDLNIDLVPTDGNSDTQWRPRYVDISYARSLYESGSGSFTVPEVTTTDTFARTGYWWMSDCPPAAQKLQEMDTTELDTYLATLVPYGSTYHDIGMIWAGRLISPTGLFQAENEDSGDTVRSRHVIWMTDGQTETYDVGYGAYGVEPLDRRRWNPDTSTLTLDETVEKRFAVACEQVKKLNVTVWVIAFGTTTTPIMEECAGPGRYFQAANATQLDAAFTKIADSLGDLRITE